MLARESKNMPASFAWITVAMALKWTVSSAQQTRGCAPPTPDVRTVCSGAGACVDNRCLCVPPRTGTFCQETCTDCWSACDELSACVRCRGHGVYWLEGVSGVVDCDSRCTNVSGVVTVQSRQAASVLVGLVCTAHVDPNCAAQFALPDADGIVYTSELTCKGQELLKTEEGNLTGVAVESSECGESESGVKRVAHGFGTLTYATNDRFGRRLYRGSFACGARHGVGQLEWLDGSVFVGEFVRGVRTGQGKLHYANGDIYEGQWKEDARHGNGSYTWKSGQQRYVGSFVNDIKEGYGEIFSLSESSEEWTPAALFSGVFSADDAADGTLRLPNGDVYVGSLSAGDLHGTGRYTETCGNVYEGRFESGLRHGQGAYTWTNGDAYSGQFEDDVPHGQGLFTWVDGSTFEGTFKRGKITKNGVHKKNGN